MSLPLVILFNTSLRTGIFPTIWKTAHVVPIFKSGDKACCSNYRPISILSCLGKLFESIVYDTLYYHIHPHISPKQHGFVRNRSTTSNLLEYKNYICRSFDKKLQVDCIYTDFAKAFDKVNHNILISKLSLYYGIHGSLLRWLKSYLSNRSQLVSIKGFLSSPKCITSGVPQGSHLGPLLFIAFINDLIEKLRNPCSLYADDLKLFSIIRNILDSISLQSDIEILKKWSQVNGMLLNVEKCFVITFTTNSVNKVEFNYMLEGRSLTRKTTIKDLGILFDEKLTFRDHYDYIINKCNKLLGFIARITKDFKNPSSFLLLYFSMIRSILEYNSIIWSPFYDIHINRIERVQNNCLRMLTCRLGLKRPLQSYLERLSKFKIHTLRSRRVYTGIITLFKILHSHIDAPTLLSQININIRPRARNMHGKTFSLEAVRTNVSLNNAMISTCRQYNEMCKKNYKDIDIFNNNIKKFHTDLKKIIFKPEGT